MKLNRQLPWLFVGPSVLLYLLIFLYPTLLTIILSFMRVDNFALKGAQLVGLQNYQELFSTPLFLQSMKNIAVIWTLGGLIVFGVSFLFTGLLHTLPERPRNFFRAMIFLPNLINVVALVTIWTQYIYNPRYGFLKTFFERLHLDSLANIPWTSPEYIFWAMFIALLWGGLGWYALIIMAGADQIPDELYEAAKLEGAGPARVFTGITLPLLQPVLRTTVVMWTIHTINLFAFVKAFSPVQTINETYTPAVYLYDLAFGSSQGGSEIQVGKAAATAVVLLVLVLLSSSLISRLMNRERLEF